MDVLEGDVHTAQTSTEGNSQALKFFAKRLGKYVGESAGRQGQDQETEAERKHLGSP